MKRPAKTRLQARVHPSIVSLALMGMAGWGCSNEPSPRPTAGIGSGGALDDTGTLAGGPGGGGTAAGAGGAGQAGSAGVGVGAVGGARDAAGGDEAGNLDASVIDAAPVVDGSSSERGDAGGEAAPAACTPGAGITDLDPSTARDNQTCLVWQKSATCLGPWKTVAQCCVDLVQGGFDDWRMPTVSELLTWAQPSTNAEYMTCPSYVNPGAGDPANNFEFCTVTTYSALTCAHRGQGTSSGTFCVRGRSDRVPPVVTATTCSPPCGLATEVVYLSCAP